MRYIIIDTRKFIFLLKILGILGTLNSRHLVFQYYLLLLWTFLNEYLKFKNTHTKTSIKVINNIETNKCIESGVLKMPKIVSKKVKFSTVTDYFILNLKLLIYMINILLHSLNINIRHSKL